MREDEKLKVVCGHKMSLSPTWVPQDPVPKYQNQKKKVKKIVKTVEFIFILF